MEKEKKNFRLLPMLLAAVVVPFVLHYHETKTNLTQFSWFGDEEFMSDIHFYYRVVVFLVVAGLMAVVFMCDAAKTIQQVRQKKKGQKASRFLEKWKASAIFLPLVAYLVLGLLSSIFAETPSYSFSMFHQMFEPVYVLFGYAICAYYIFFYLENEQAVRVLLRGFTVVATILSVIGILQMQGKFSFSSGLFRWLVYPWDAVLENSTMQTDRIAGSSEMVFGNSNFAGGYIALVLPLFVLLLVDAVCRLRDILKEDRQKKTVVLRSLDIAWYAVLIVLLIINLIGTQTDSGKIALVVCALVAVVFLLRRLHLKGWMIAGLGILSIVGVIAANAATGNALWNKIQEKLGNNEFRPVLQAIETNDDNITVTYNQEKFILHLDANEDYSWYEFTVTDGAGSPIAGQPNEADPTITDVTDARFPGFQYAAFVSSTYDASGTPVEYKGIEIIIDGHQWYFTIGEDGTYYYFTQYLKLDKIANPERASILEGKETLMSHRGYIWSLTLPMLRKYIFLGAGANSFFSIFPNDDYVQVYNLGDTYKFIDKPHNMYLQQFIQIGGLGCVAFLVFFLWYLVSCCRLYWNCGFQTGLQRIGFGSMLGIFSYLVFGLTNDSMPVLAPLFWCLVGIGMGVNYLVRRSEEN